VESVRSFVAIELPEELKRELAKVQETLKAAGAKVGWASAETMHLTLKFLGDVERVRLVEVARALETVAAGFQPWEVELKGLGQFPVKGKPRVLWAGVEGGRERTIELAEAVEEALMPVGFRPEKRRFHPHVTIGRVRSGSDLEALSEAVSQAGDLRFGSFEVETVTTFESELAPQGALHTAVATVELGREAPG